MTFVDCYLPYFRQRLITSLLLVLLLFQPLFTESSHGNQLLSPTPFSSMLCVSFSVPCLLFNFFFVGQGISLPGGYAGLSQGSLGEYLMMFGANLLVWQMCPKQVWNCHLMAWESSCFLSVMWHGETFHRLGVQGVKVLILLGALFPPSVAPVSQQYF
jgi:hypothetical protein